LSDHRLDRFLERLLVPKVHSVAPEAGSPNTDIPVVRIDDFRRVVAVVASAAVGFFVPSLVLARVPTADWIPFTLAAGVAGLLIGGSFYVLADGNPWAVPAAVFNVAVIGGLGVLYGSSYNELALLYALMVAGHAIVHGIRPALLAAILGGYFVPFVLQGGQRVNASDPIYSLIYLSGIALIPWTAGRLARRRATALREQLQLTIGAEREAVMILARAAEAKDHVTGDHVVRVGDLSAELGLRTGLSAVEADDLRFAGMLHDVGKLHLPDQILTKRGPLSPAEWELVKMHTIWGERILGTTDGFELARRIARWHHENFDGSGYPDGLRGERIPLAARIVRLADVFDALRNERPYKEAWNLDRALDELHRGAGSLFDPELTRAFISLLVAKGAHQLVALPPGPAEVGLHAPVPLRRRRTPPAATVGARSSRARASA
jgi:hypothetical protein